MLDHSSSLPATAAREMVETTAVLFWRVRMDIGNLLNQLAVRSRVDILGQGELFQFTFAAFNIAMHNTNSMDEEPIVIHYPIGFRPDRTVIPGERRYSKLEIAERYQFLSDQQLARNTILQCVTVVEALFSDIIRTIVKKYPNKLERKRTIPLQIVFDASSIEELYVAATDNLVNELSYKSPSDFADDFGKLVGIRLLECPSYHRYCEIKATRDILLHNRGLANEVYLRKAGHFARVKKGQPLPVNSAYFLESYEYFLQLTEWLEIELHQRWHSSEYEERRRQPQLPFGDQEQAPE